MGYLSAACFGQRLPPGRSRRRPGCCGGMTYGGETPAAGGSVRGGREEAAGTAVGCLRIPGRLQPQFQSAATGALDRFSTAAP